MAATTRTLAQQLVKARGPSSRGLFTSSARRAVTPFRMPAMSPTMTEGGIASWNKQPGESFSVGDILLEIETDKATMDVEAQDDGIMGKIILENGTKNIPVGKIIAMLAEEGDDISSIEVPTEDSTPAPSKSEPKSESSSSSPPSSSSSESAPPVQEQKSTLQPSHSGPIQHAGPRPLFPSVSRLLHSHNVSSTEGIKGTGMHGMITKGDVLAHLGLIKTPWGSAEKVEINALGEKKGSASGTGAGKKVGGEGKKEEPKKVYDARTVRELILSGMAKAGQPKAASPSVASFDDIISDYLPAPPAPKQATLVIPPPAKSGSSAYFDGLL